MTTSSIEPGAAPRHQCINAACGCNDLVTAGPCTEWCATNGVEAADVLHGAEDLKPCGCGHQHCRDNQPAERGEISTSPERGSG